MKKVDTLTATIISDQSLGERVRSLDQILAHVPAAVLFSDASGRLVYLNRQAQSYFEGMDLNGLKLELWPKRLGFFKDENKQAYPIKKMPPVRALEGARVHDVELFLRTDSMEKGLWVCMSAEPIYDEDGDLEGVVTFFYDFAWQKRVNSEREMQKRRTEILYALSHKIAGMGSDLERILQAVSKHTSEAIGDACVIALYRPTSRMLEIADSYHHDRKSRKQLTSMLSKVKYPMGEGLISRVVKSGEPMLLSKVMDQEALLFDLAGYPKYLEKVGLESLMIVPIEGRNQTLGAILASRDRAGAGYQQEDLDLLKEIAHSASLAIEHCYLVESLQEEIQERKNTEKALAESEARFRSMFESNALGMKILDDEGNIMQVNPAFKDMIGYAYPEILNRHFSTFLHPADMGRAKKIFQDLIEGTRKEINFQHRVLDKDGRVIWFNATFTALQHHKRSSKVDLVVSITENITEQKQIEREMIELKNRLQESLELERLRLSQELHDGPMQELYSAIFQAESLRRSLDEKQDATLLNIRDEIQGVLNELRSIAKELRPPTIGNFGLEKAVRSHAEDFREKYPQIHINLDLAHDRQLLPENTRLALFRIYQHALANVVRHAEASEVDVHFSFDAEEARLEVCDNGKGFDVPRNWVQMARKGHFGLAGAAERVEALNGRFSVESKPNNGTLVRAVIPICDEVIT